MGQKEIKILKYLDDAVSYEKDKHMAIKEKCFPFSFGKVIKAVQDLDEEKYKSISDCAKMAIAKKVINNVILRRFFELFIRENFENVDFSQLSNIPKYRELKKKILKNDPELMHVDDGAFLRQIANAIAHGNYVDLLGIDEIENSFVIRGEDISFENLRDVSAKLFFQNDFSRYSSEYDENTKSLIEKLNEKSEPIEMSPLEYVQCLINNGTHSAEALKFRYESNFTIDANGTRVRRPTTKYYDLDISFKDFDQILLFVLSSAKQHKRVVPIKKHNIGNIEPLDDENTLREDAENLLKVYDISIHDFDNNTDEIIQLDDHQKEFFINDYIQTREMFSRDFFKKIYDVDILADLLSTNAGTQYFGLSNLYTNSKMEKLSATMFALSNNIKTYFSFVNNSLTPSKDQNLHLYEIVEEWQKKTYFFRQVLDTYSESLITEILLLLQILEDGQKLNLLRDNGNIKNIIKTFDPDTLNRLRMSSKYDDDCITILHHLRNSFTHLTYLNNSNDEIFVYDQISKRNKNKEYKFTISIDCLELLKDELLSTVNILNQDMEEQSSM